MKPLHHASPRSPHRQRGIALIITISVLAIMLVLVVGYATVSRTFALSAASHRDYVSSRFLAMGAFNRAMAEIAYAYATNAAVANSGVSSIYSAVDTNNAGYFAGGYATDIERMLTNAYTGLEVTQKGADGITDWVVLPGQDPANLATRPQWLAMTNDQGLLIGRIAYVITGGGLNINAIANLLASGVSGGPVFNARNEGYSAAELNLPAALMAIDSTTWTYANATNDATAILNYRYGDGVIGDNRTYPVDGRDKNGDGSIDAAPLTGVPQNYLDGSDGTANKSIFTLGSPPDNIISDLKQLHSGTIGNDAASQTRFLTRFSDIQRYFTTQSSAPVPWYMVNLNDTYRYPDQASLFAAITNQMSTFLPFSTNTAAQRAQVAANIVSYISTNGLNSAPYNVGAVAGTTVVGVGRTPFVNEVAFDLIASVTLTNLDGTAGLLTNDLIVTSVTCMPRVEFWYPYTDALPASGRKLDFTYRFLDNTTEFAMGAVQPEPNVDAANGAIGATAFGTGIVGVDHFPTNVLPTITLGGAGTKTWPLKRDTTYTPPTAVVVSNFYFEALLREGAYTNDFASAYTNRLGVLFTPDQILGAVGAQTTSPYTSPLLTVANRCVTGALTNAVVFARNDPRIREWFPAFANAVSNTTMSSYNTIGTTNPAASSISYAIPTATNIFRPDLGEDGDYQFSGLSKGIGPKTFYVKVSPSRQFSSVAELGRVHRGSPWRTIDLKGGGTDGNLLDHFTIVINTNSPNSYVHGRININSQADALPIWAALFAGMPIKTTVQGTGAYLTNWLDTTAGGEVDPAFTKSREMGKIFGSRAGAFSHLGALTSISDFTNITANHSSAFTPTANFTPHTDEDREEILSRIANLVGTQSQGNSFMIWAWGQSLRGPPAGSDVEKANTNRFVAAETLAVGMVRPEFTYLPPSGPPYTSTNLSLKVIYYRYNPDLELY